MLKKYKELSEKHEASVQKGNTVLTSLSDATHEVSDHANVFLNDVENVNIIISDIDKSFAEKTGIINPKDMIFLWSAVAIQCARWILIPTFDINTLTPDKSDRKDSGSEGKKDKSASSGQMDKDRDKNGRHDEELPNREMIMKYPVPYDAFDGTEDIVIPGVTPYGKKISSKNHHEATLGHDPIIGQIVGTANIMTRSVTFHDTLLTTRKVTIPSGRHQTVVRIPMYGIPQMFSDVFVSTKEDKGRIKVALLKENLHLQSDKYTKWGLPIPFLSAKLQHILLTKGWNSKELENVIKGSIKGIELNFFLALIINSIIGNLHGFCYDETTDGSLSLYGVRTRKVIVTSNVIAEGINLASVVRGTIVGVISENPDKVRKSISHMDIGGIIEAIHQIAGNGILQERIRREFLEQELYQHFTSNRYSFLEDSCYE